MFFKQKYFIYSKCDDLKNKIFRCFNFPAFDFHVRIQVNLNVNPKFVIRCTT